MTSLAFTVRAGYRVNPAMFTSSGKATHLQALIAEQAALRAAVPPGMQQAIDEVASDLEATVARLSAIARGSEPATGFADAVTRLHAISAHLESAETSNPNP